MNSTTTGTSVRKRAPPPQNLVKGLQTIAAATLTKNEPQISSDVRVYLQAVGWIEKKGELLEMTSRGEKLLIAWKQLTVETIFEWYEWCRDASQDILSLQTQQQIQDVLSRSNNWLGDDNLANQLGFSLKITRTQLLLANAFGLLVRLNGKSWQTQWKSLPEATALILNTAIELRCQANSISRGVRVDKIFTTLLNTMPLSLPNFRAGVFELLKQGKIEVGGSVPDARSSSNVKIKILLPSQDGVQHPVLDSGFLTPDKSCKVIIPLENAA